MTEDLVSPLVSSTALESTLINGWRAHDIFSLCGQDFTEFINELITSLTAASGPHSNVGASSVAEDPVSPSLLDAMDRSTMNDNKKRTVEPVFCTCSMYPRCLPRELCGGSAVFLLLFI